MKKTNTVAQEANETVFIPKHDRHDDSLFVAVNGKRILVKKGEPVSLPKAFAEVIKNSFAAQSQAEDFINSARNDG